jgi:hypothetical protein
MKKIILLCIICLCVNFTYGQIPQHLEQYFVARGCGVGRSNRVFTPAIRAELEKIALKVLAATEFTSENKKYAIRYLCESTQDYSIIVLPLLKNKEFNNEIVSYLRTKPSPALLKIVHETIDIRDYTKFDFNGTALINLGIWLDSTSLPYLKKFMTLSKDMVDDTGFSSYYYISNLSYQSILDYQKGGAVKLAMYKKRLEGLILHNSEDVLKAILLKKDIEAIPILREVTAHEIVIDKAENIKIEGYTPFSAKLLHARKALGDTTFTSEEQAILKQYPPE